MSTEFSLTNIYNSKPKLFPWVQCSYRTRLSYLQFSNCFQRRKCAQFILGFKYACRCLQRGSVIFISKGKARGPKDRVADTSPISIHLPLVQSLVNGLKEDGIGVSVPLQCCCAGFATGCTAGAVRQPEAMSAHSPSELHCGVWNLRPVNDPSTGRPSQAMKCKNLFTCFVGAHGDRRATALAPEPFLGNSRQIPTKTVQFNGLHSL